MLPRTITYETVPGRWGFWTATIETSAGRISVTRPSLRETREALEDEMRDLSRAKVRPERKAGESDRRTDRGH
jgi:hypothetical protein